MTESRRARSGEVAYFCAAAVFAVVAIASVAWVLAAPSTVDDQGTRATFAGWALGIFALLLSVAAAAFGFKRKNSSRAGGSVVNSGDVFGGQQNISEHGTGNIGGIHFHGDADRSDRS